MGEEIDTEKTSGEPYRAIQSIEAACFGREYAEADHRHAEHLPGEKLADEQSASKA